jgi:methionyl-tRNA formyltransferase
LLRRTLGDVARGVEPEPQPEAGATHARMLTTSDGRIDWTRPASEIERQVRGLDPWPGTFTTWRGRSLKVRRVAREAGDLAAGELRVERDRVLAGTGRGLLVLSEVQPEGKPILEGVAWARGARPAEHDRLGN